MDSSKTVQILSKPASPGTDADAGSPRRRRRSRSRWAVVALIAAGSLGLGLTACSSDTKSQTGAPQASATVDAAMKYAQCMRSNGIASFPDPVDGTFKLKVEKGGELDPDTTAYKTAADACKQYAPAGMAGSNQNGTQQAQMLKFAACMRDNGVKNFPDPVDGRLMITRDQVNLDSPEFTKAQQACQALAPAGGALPPGGPVSP